MKQCMLTTMDNPWNPFTRTDEWLAFDISHGYGTWQLLAYLARTSTELEDEDYHEAVLSAMDDLLELNPFGIHYRVYEDEADTVIKLANEAFNANNTLKAS